MFMFDDKIEGKFNNFRTKAKNTECKKCKSSEWSQFYIQGDVAICKQCFIKSVKENVQVEEFKSVYDLK